MYLDTDEVEARVDKSSLSQGDEDANVSVEDGEEKAEDGESLGSNSTEHYSFSKNHSSYGLRFHSLLGKSSKLLD